MPIAATFIRKMKNSITNSYPNFRIYSSRSWHYGFTKLVSQLEHQLDFSIGFSCSSQSLEDFFAGEYLVRLCYLLGTRQMYDVMLNFEKRTGHVTAGLALSHLDAASEKPNQNLDIMTENESNVVQVTYLHH